jgi:hypothetical protein
MALLFAGIALTGGTARAQVSDLAITGSVTGSLRAGGRATFRLEATVPGGWRGLRELRMTMLLHGLILAETTYYEQFDAIAVRGSQLVHPGTDREVAGSFFRISGLDVTTRAFGDGFALTVRATVRQNIPSGTEFRLTAVGDDGAEASVKRSAPSPPPEVTGRSPWASLAIAVIGAFLIGGFLGNTFASHRRGAKPALSVYEIVEKRLKLERARPPASVPGGEGAPGGPTG